MVYGDLHKVLLNSRLNVSIFGFMGNLNRWLKRRLAGKERASKVHNHSEPIHQPIHYTPARYL